MKIAQIVCVFPPYRGGIGNVAYNFALELARFNNEVTVFTPVRGQQRANFSGFNFIELSPFLYYGNGAFLPQLFGRLKNFDIVHLHYPFFGGAEPVWFSKVLGQAGKKLVIHYHMDIQSLPTLAKILSLVDNFIRSSLLVRAEAITCASLDYLKNSQIRKLYQQMPTKFMEIPFGVDNERFKPNSNWLQQKNNILFVGSLDRAHSFKGLNVLLDSLVLLKKEIKLTVVGDGDLLAQYQAQVEKRQIQARVNFAGAVVDEELSNFYQSADLLVLPSLNAHEAFGLVLVEAMASGIPVVASALPGVRSVFVDGEQGYLSEPGNPASLVEKIEQALNNKENWVRLCRNAFSFAREKYSWKLSGEKLNNLYLDLLGK